LAESDATSLSAPIDALEQGEHQSERRCYVCMDDDGEDGNPLLVGVCACSSSGIHAECLERLVNSKVSRSKPLAERMACGVCLEPYNEKVLATHVLCEPPETAVEQFVSRPRVSLGLLIGSFFCGSVFLILGLWQLGRKNMLFATLSILALVIAFDIIRRRRSLTRSLLSPQRLQTLDDTVFFERVIALAREAVASGAHADQQAVDAAQPCNVVVVVRRVRDKHVVESASTSRRTSVSSLGSSIRLSTRLSAASIAVEPAAGARSRSSSASAPSPSSDTSGGRAVAEIDPPSAGAGGAAGSGSATANDTECCASV
jgi:hypothetical protein